MKYESINVSELKKLNESNDNFTLVDVRTHPERIQAEIPIDSIHIPMNEIPDRLEELNNNDNIIIYCKSGKRSARVCEYLTENNFKKVANLSGGILAWAEQINPDLLFNL